MSLSWNWVCWLKILDIKFKIVVFGKFQLKLGVQRFITPILIKLKMLPYKFIVI